MNFAKNKTTLTTTISQSCLSEQSVSIESRNYELMNFQNIFETCQFSNSNLNFKFEKNWTQFQSRRNWTLGLIVWIQLTMRITLYTSDGIE